MKILELFSGTESFSKVAEERGHKIFTIDFDKKFNPDLCMDILDFDISMLPEEFQHPDIIWASPPCTEYSKAKSQGIRDIEKANKIVLVTLKIIKEINPKFWIIENPATGKLIKQDFMKGLPFTDISYCKYGFPYRKQTRLWNNFGFKGKVCNKDCEFLTEGLKGKRHIGSVGTGGQGKGHKISYTNKSFKKEEKYIVPKKLCLDIIKSIEKIPNKEARKR